MTPTGVHPKLSVGAEVVLGNQAWTVRKLIPSKGKVILVGPSGKSQVWSIGRVMGEARWPAIPANDRDQQPACLDDLGDEQLDRLRNRLSHALEAQCGFRSGDPNCPEPGEPRPHFDPAVTTLQQRYERKAEELRQLSPLEARLLGLEHMSARTLRRLADSYSRDGGGLANCIDGRIVRTSPGHPSITPEIAEAIEAVHAEHLHRSRLTMRTREVLINQYVRDKHGDNASIPHYTTLRKVWKEWFGPGGSRQRYERSAASVDAPGFAPVVPRRPGQVVALDSTPLPVLLRQHEFAPAMTAHLTLAMDVYTRSLVAFRLTLGSDTAVEVGLVLRDVMMPLPMRPGWGEDMAWPYPGVPKNLVGELVGYEVAGLPFFAPDTVTTDHGAIYKSHHVVEVERTLGCNILPARAMKPTDKAACERAFRSAQTMLFESLPGFRGVDVADRGADPEGDATLTMSTMEHIIATWIVRVWQNRRLGAHAPSWAPAGRHSPNTLFAASFAQAGFGLQIPSPDTFYGVLPASYVTIPRRRGVKISNLWYDGAALDDFRGKRSPRSGKHAGLWRIRSDPRDRREVFFEHPTSGEWHQLRWTGLPPDGDIPAFDDARVDEVLAEARQRGLTPRSDEELLPVLLDLLDEHSPVAAWPGQKSGRGSGKRQQAKTARAQQRGAAAARDRSPSLLTAETGAVPEPTAESGQTNHIRGAVNEQRRRKRERSIVSVPPLPRPLGAGQRANDLFAVPDEEQGTDSTSSAVAQTWRNTHEQ